MAYSADTFVADEQPTTEKWNKLWSNDASFNDGTGIGDDTIDSRHYVAGSVDYEHVGPDLAAYQVLADVTLGGASDSLSSGTFTAKKFLLIWAYVINSGALSMSLRFNNDSGSNYAYSYISSAGNGTSISQTAVQAVSGTGNFACIAEVPGNLTSSHKLGFWRTILAAASAGTAPTNYHFPFVWNNTSSQITRVDLLNSGAGDMASGSRLVVYGRD